MAHVSKPLMGARSSLTWLAPMLVIVLVVGLWWFANRDDSTGSASAPGTRASSTAGANTPDSGLGTIAESKLPKEARATLTLIRAGGPYKYDQDDKTFQNREGNLPGQKKGYYREYTVVTPGSGDRGARRIIGGRDGDRYWTDDHYDSFRQIQEGQ